MYSKFIRFRLFKGHQNELVQAKNIVEEGFPFGWNCLAHYLALPFWKHALVVSFVVHVNVMLGVCSNPGFYWSYYALPFKQTPNIELHVVRMQRSVFGYTIDDVKARAARKVSHNSNATQTQRFELFIGATRQARIIPRATFRNHF